jgi:hypothetical protein
VILDDNQRRVAATTVARTLLGITIEDLRQKQVDDFIPAEVPLTSTTLEPTSCEPEHT